MATGTIKGIIKDMDTGEGIGFAKITLSQNSKPIDGKFISHADGKFTIPNLNPGIYEVSITAGGYLKKSESNIRVLSGQSTSLVIKIKRQSKIESEIKPAPIKKDKAAEMVIMDEPVLHNSRSQRESPLSTGYVGYPAADFNTEQYDYTPENEFHEVVHTPLSTFSIDVDGASYANIRRFLNQGQLPPVDAVRIEEMINYFKYDYTPPKGQEPFAIHTELTECPWNRKHQLVSIGLQGKKTDVKNIPPSNLVFLIDVSGSMMSADKLPLLKKALSLLTDQLRPVDRVSMVVYAGSSGLVLPPTPGSEKSTIVSALESLRAGGSTAGGAGIQLTYKVALENFIRNGNNRVILATDGDFNVGASSDGELVRMIEEKRESGVFLTVLGFGTGNLKDSKMEKLANKGNGNYAYIDNLMEAKKVLVNEMGGTLFTIAKDVKVQIEFNPALVKAYKLIGYENRLLQAKDFNDDKKDAGELGSGHTVTALYEIVPAGSDVDISSIDPLRYQIISENNTNSGELLTVKFRYKDPDGDTSKLITRSLKGKPVAFDRASANIRFASAVAVFGLILRNSPYKADANYSVALKIARSAKGGDSEGYRSEFIRLAEMAELLKSNYSIKN
jgi:Ca-activated chloride channel homolog